MLYASAVELRSRPRSLTGLWHTGRMLVASVTPKQLLDNLLPSYTYLWPSTLARGREYWRLIEPWRKKGNGACSPSDFALLYAVATALTPTRILETGTGAGISTTALALALRDGPFPYARVLTTDLRDESYTYGRVGEAIPVELERWVERYELEAKQFLLERMTPAFDLVLLDDDHRPEQQLAEVELVRKYGGEDTLLFCDDAGPGWVKAVGSRLNCAFLGATWM